LSGFEIRDTLMWLYGTGFPKSLNVGKALDKLNGRPSAPDDAFREYLRAAIKAKGTTQAGLDRACGTNGMAGHWCGTSQPEFPSRKYWPTIKSFLDLDDRYAEVIDRAEAEREVLETKHDSTARNVAIMTGKGDYDVTAAATDEAKEWDGYGTALKPAYEPIILCRKPLDGTVANNVLTHSTGALNIDGCRIPSTDDQLAKKYASVPAGYNKDKNIYGNDNSPRREAPHDAGRWPANVMHDGCLPEPYDRYFYCAKTSKADREAGLETFDYHTAGECVKRETGSAGADSPRAGAGRTSGAKNIHPTVKPTELMRWCCRLIGHPGAVIMDPFSGSGSTGRGAVLEGFGFIGFEMGEKFCAISNARILDAIVNKR
jgi:hypothetical protein